jgi:hypothetical protein
MKLSPLVTVDTHGITLAILNAESGTPAALNNAPAVDLWPPAVVVFAAMALLTVESELTVIAANV